MPVRAKIWELEKKFGTLGSDAGSSVFGPSGVGGTNAIAGGCRPGVVVGASGMVIFGVAGLENVKGRALMGGSSRPEGVSSARRIDVTDGGYRQMIRYLPLKWTRETYRSKTKPIWRFKLRKIRTDTGTILPLWWLLGHNGQVICTVWFVVFIRRCEAISRARRANRTCTIWAKVSGFPTSQTKRRNR